jgi:hypothetical protein
MPRVFIPRGPEPILACEMRDFPIAAASVARCPHKESFPQLPLRSNETSAALRVPERCSARLLNSRALGTSDLTIRNEIRHLAAIRSYQPMACCAAGSSQTATNGGQYEEPGEVK